MTTVKAQCPSCQASYQVPKEREGARFKCKKCGESVTVPRTEAAPPPVPPVIMPVTPAASSRPVVMPVTPTASERPVVMPAKPAAGERPVVMPAAPAASERPVVMPARPAASAARPERRPARPGRAAEVPEPPPPVKSHTTMVLVVLVLLVAIGAGGYFLWPKGGAAEPEKPKTDTPEVSQPDKPKSSVREAAARIKQLRSETGADSAGQLWALAQKLEAEAKAWHEAKADEEAAKLELERDAVLEELVKLSPGHAEARAMRGEMRYDKELDAFFDAAYLNDSERDLVRANRLRVDTKAAENGGWIPKTHYESLVKPLVEKFTVAQAAAESMAASPFGKSAKNLEGQVLGDLSKLLGGKTAFRAFIHEPYLIFVEENPGWSPQSEAKTLFSPLKAIHEAFLREFGGLGLKPLDEPVPVMYFKSEEQYGEYNKALGHDSKNVLAHYEPLTGRLALNRGVNHEVTIHEGTHQLFDRYTTNKLAHPLQSFWFQEGIAEWFGGSNRTKDPKDGSWTYETGVLLDGRLDEWNTLAESEFTLADLLNQTYAKRNEYMLRGGEGQKKIGLVYAQGWFLIYFLNHFVVDETGMVKIGTKGKYADGWNDYLKAELAGKTGKKVFMECLKIDDAALENMNKEYHAYFDFVRRKRNLGQVQEKKLVPWDQYVNQRGKKTGEKEDDMLMDVRKKKETEKEK